MLLSVISKGVKTSNLLKPNQSIIVQLFGSNDDRASSSHHGDTGHDDADVTICGEHWPHGGWSTWPRYQVGWHLILSSTLLILV